MVHFVKAEPCSLLAVRFNLVTAINNKISYHSLSLMYKPFQKKRLIFNIVQYFGTPYPNINELFIEYVLRRHSSREFPSIV